MKHDTTMDPRQYNQAFLAFLDNDQDSHRKFAAAGATYVRDHLREEGFFRRIIPPEDLDPTDNRVIPAKDNDTLVVRKDLEPNSKAVSLTFGALADAVIVSSRRVDVPIHTIASDWFQIREQHLLAYEMPITKIIERNTGKDIQEIEDLTLMRYTEAAVASTGARTLGVQAQADKTAEGKATGRRFDIQRPDYVNLVNLMLADGNRKRVDKILMDDIDFNNLLKWTVEDMGDKVQSETLLDGYSYDRVLGYKVVRSIKTDLLQPGNIYGFTEPEYLGFFFILNDVKFYLDKTANLISWYAWEDVGALMANISSIVKLETYNGVADGDDSSDSLPTQADLFRQTNPAASGGAVFPAIELG